MANSNVIFGNVDLGICSPYFEVIDIKDGGVERSITALDPSRMDGMIFANLKNGIRVITVSFSILTEIMTQRFEALKRLNYIVSAREPMRLKIPTRPGMYIDAICSAVPSPSALDWTEELAAQFIAHDPYFRPDVEDISVTLTAGGSVNMFVNCPGYIRPKISQTVASTLTDPTWTCSNGQMIMLQGSVAAGALVIDCEAGDVTLAGVSILDQLTLDSQFFKLDPNPVTNNAPYTITCANGAAGRVHGKSRWL